MKKLYWIFTIMVLSFSLAAFAQAGQDAQSGEGSGHGRGAGRGGMNADAQLERMSRTLNLTDDQKTKIKPILENQDKQMHELMQDSSVSQEDRRSKFQEIRQNTMSQIKPILTSDQQKKLESMHERGGEGHGHGGRPDQSSPQ
jgi:Spy/CpxP family protein refolding chaperone